MSETLPTSNAVEYTRRLYDDVLGWYHSADAKAQVILGLDGAFLAFLTAGAFQDPDDLRGITARFSESEWTWLLLGLMTATLTASMAAAIFCLWSRIYIRPGEVVDRISAASTPSVGGEYSPGVMWFFQHVSVLDEPRFERTLEKVDRAFELHAIATQIKSLSRNVRSKHIAVNVGFALTVLTLLLFAMAAASYVVAVMGPG